MLRRIVSAIRRCAGLALIIYASTFVHAQEVRMMPSPSVTAAASSEQVRFISFDKVTQVRLEVFSPTGEKLFDSGFKPGDLLDWGLRDEQGQRLADGSYLCVVTLKDVAGRLSQRHGMVSLQERKVSMREVKREQLAPSQAQAWAASREAQAVSPAEDGDLAVMVEDEAEALTAVMHDGVEGRVARSRGALSFRVGDFLIGLDREQMRLTEDGSLGIGVKKPRARLDVAGDIHATGLLLAARGIEFADGTVQTSGLSGHRDAQGNIISDAAGTGTPDRLAKWIDNVGTLGDAAGFETSGLVFFGQNNSGQVAPLFPQGPQFHVLEIGASGMKTPLTLAGGSGVMEFWKDLGGGTASPAAAVAFGMARPGLAATNDMVFSTFTAAASWNERLRLTSAGDLGVGTSSPQAKLDVVGNLRLSGSGNGIIFPDGTKQTTANTGGGGGVSGTGTTGTVPLWSGSTTLGNSIIAQTNGNVGIGTTAPSERLQVEGNIWLSGPGATITVNNTDSSSNPNLYLRDGTGAHNAGRISTDGGDIEFAPSNVPKMIVTNSGNVGIGTTTSPSAKLEIKAPNVGTNSLLRFIDSGGNANWKFDYVDVDGSLRLTPNSSLYTFLITTGNVGVGVINPSSKLTVAGVIESTSGGIKFPDGTVQTTAGGGGGAAGVKSLNALTGSVTLAAGANVSITPSGNTLTIAASVPSAPAVSLSCTTVAQNYTGSINLSCASGYTAVLASCQSGGNVIINGQTPSPPVGTFSSYLTPNVTAATGVHCDANSLSSQALLRCCKNQ